MKNLFISILDFLVPRLCFSCQARITEPREIICKDCKLKLEKASGAFIQREFLRKFVENGLITEFASLYVFEKDGVFQSLVHKLKYSSKFTAGIYLGEKIADAKGGIINGWEIDFICPVPIHHVKKAERGYNQSFYIAKGISKRLKIPVKQSTLSKIKFTKSQTTLSIYERRENINDTFRCNEKSLSGKNIMLVDDIITTGATVEACADKLKKAGAKNVYAISAALADL